jgi:SAM-dependent methyltransferase
VSEQGKRLTDQSYWENGYINRPPPTIDATNRKAGWLHRWAAQERISSRIFWDTLLSRYVPMRCGATVVEIGSAPGRNLLEFNRRFGYVPFGIEYTAAGAEVNRELFRQHNLDPDTVIQADLFDDQRLAAYRERFDIVYSAGLIEHFDDSRGAVERHVSLLAPGGILIVTIPNLRGLNWILCKLSCPDLLGIHNLNIMDPRRWRALFEGLGLTHLHSGSYGVIDLGLIDGHPSMLGEPALKMLRVANIMISGALQHVPNAFLIDTRWTSPLLVYIGRKDAHER